MAVTWFDPPVVITPGVLAAWQTVDLSAQIPVGTSGIIFHAYSPVWNALLSTIGLRKTGSIDNRTNFMYGCHGWGIIGVDANRRVDIFVKDAAQDVRLVGAITSGITMFTNGVNYVMPGVGWNEVDFSGDVPAGAVGIVLEVTNANLTDFNCRKTGSTDNRFSRWGSRGWAVIGVDGNRHADIYVNNVAVVIHLLGYITADAVFHTNAVDVSLGGAAAWTDLAALPAGAVGGIYELGQDVGSYFYGMRRDGSADAWLGAQDNRRKWALIQANLQLVEGYIVDLNTDMFEVGWFSGPTGGVPYNVGTVAMMAGG